MNMKRKRKWNDYKLFLFVLPGIVFTFLFAYLPLWGWGYAFIKYKPGKEILESTFVGFDHFKTLINNPLMQKNILRVMRNTFGIQGINYLLTPVPMLFAILLSEVRSKKFQKVVQTVTTLPHFISWVIMYSLALAIMGTNGALNSMLKELGMEPVGNLLNSNKNVWLTQSLLLLWKELGWKSIVYFAAIAGLDQGIYEAAMVDGAGKWQRIRYITIPQLIPTYFVLLIMQIGSFLNNGVDQFLVFGNALNKEYIEVLDLYVYNIGIGSGLISYSVAIGMLKSIVAVVLFAGANYVSKKVRGSSVF